VAVTSVHAGVLSGFAVPSATAGRGRRRSRAFEVVHGRRFGALLRDQIENPLLVTQIRKGLKLI
jgi:hypothetical protein